MVADAPIIYRHAYALFSKDSDQISLIDEVLNHFDPSAEYPALEQA